MATTKVGNFPADCDLYFILGDDFVKEWDFNTDITGRTYAAEILDEVGTVVVAFTCTVTDAANGLVDMVLTDTQTSAIPRNGRDVPCLFWYFAETISSTTTTLIKGKVIAGVR